MTVLAIVESKGSMDDYRRVSEALDFKVTPPSGLVFHAIADLGDGALKAIDVWNSPQAAQDFYEDRLRPAVAALAPENADFPMPELRELADVVHP